MLNKTGGSCAGRRQESWLLKCITLSVCWRYWRVRLESSLGQLMARQQAQTVIVIGYVCSFVHSCVCITNKSGNLKKKQKKQNHTQRQGNTTQHGHLHSLMMHAGQKKKLFKRNTDQILFMPTHAWYFIQQIMLNKSWLHVWLARRDQINAKLSIHKIQHCFAARNEYILQQQATGNDNILDLSQDAERKRLRVSLLTSESRMTSLL